MADFQQGFVEKLATLNSTQLSIESLSKWMIFNYKHAKTLTAIWEKELRKNQKPERFYEEKIVFCYLANDVMQNSRKKGKDYLNEFAKYLHGVFGDLSRTCPQKIIESTLRLVKIWEDRQVFEPAYLAKLRRILTSDGEDARRSTSSSAVAAYSSPVLSGPAAKLGESLVRVANAGKNCETMSSQRAQLRPVLFDPASSNQPHFEAAEVSGAAQLVGEEKAALEEFKRELTSCMQLLRDLLKEQVATYTENETRLKQSEERFRTITALQEKVGPSMAFRSSAGSAPPPPVADSDDEGEGAGGEGPPDEPAAKRPRAEEDPGGEEYDPS